MDDNTSLSPTEINWSDHLEIYFKETAEKSQGLAWLHKKAEELFYKATVFIDLPVIILGTINGSISVGSHSLFGDASYAPIIIGMVILLSSILTTIGTYFSWSRRSESHKISAISYSKLYRFITIELSLPRKERLPPNAFLKMIRAEYDRLAEISPLIPSSIIKAYKEKFGTLTTISHAEGTNGLHPVVINNTQGQPTDASYTEV